MKPCATNRKKIAWLLLGTLENESALELRRHLARCPRCRRYHDEISKVASTVSHAAPEGEAAVPESFHRRLTVRLNVLKRASAVSRWGTSWGDLLAPRAALPALAVAAAVVVLFVALFRNPLPVLPPEASRPKTVGNPQVASAPLTIAYYRFLANDSPDRLDELLSKQAKENLPAAAIYKAGSALAAAIE